MTQPPRGMLGGISLMWEFAYLFPVAIVVAVLANSSGFSGGVLFQPIFFFVVGLPLPQSIATGIATETIGMTSGAYRYWRMRAIDTKSLKTVLPFVTVGVVIGVFTLASLPVEYLRLLVGLVVAGIAAWQIRHLVRPSKAGSGTEAYTLRKYRWVSCISGVFSASTGTGVAEIQQPLFERKAQLPTKRANATAIATEAIADATITAINLTMGNIRLDVLLWTGTGVLIGGQLGALLSSYLPDRQLKITFALAVLGIGSFYLVTAGRTIATNLLSR